MDIFKDLGTDEKKELEGVWTDLDLDSDARFLIAALGNPRYMDALQTLRREYREKLVAGGVDEMTARIEVECGAIADGVLLGWEGLERNGKTYEYSRANAVELLRQVPVIRRLIRSHAASLTPFRYDIEDDAGAQKNSVAPSAGN